VHTVTPRCRYEAKRASQKNELDTSTWAITAEDAAGLRQALQAKLREASVSVIDIMALFNQVIVALDGALDGVVMALTDTLFDLRLTLMAHVALDKP
jgi:hypothetical protein